MLLLCQLLLLWLLPLLFVVSLVVLLVVVLVLVLWLVVCQVQWTRNDLISDMFVGCKMRRSNEKCVRKGENWSGANGVADLILVWLAVVYQWFSWSPWNIRHGRVEQVQLLPNKVGNIGYPQPQMPPGEPGYIVTSGIDDHSLWDFTEAHLTNGSL